MKEEKGLRPSEPEHESTKPEKPEQPDPSKPRELTPEEREELRKKIEQARRDDPNIYPVF
jgi:hypothetical protein